MPIENPAPKYSTKSGYKHHTDECDMDYRNTNADGVRAFWCETHGQWAYNFPTSVTYNYDYDKEVMPDATS